MSKSVSDYLKHNKEAYLSEIAEALGIGLKETHRQVEVLLKQKKIEVVKNV